jgi:hypothetical protein
MVTPLLTPMEATLGIAKPRAFEHKRCVFFSTFVDLFDRPASMTVLMHKQGRMP